MTRNSLLFLIVILFSTQTKAIEEASLRIVANEHPLLQYEKEGEIKGPSANILKSILNKANLNASVEFMPWPRAYSIAEKRPNTIILSMIRTPEREAKFHWLGIVSKLARVFIAIKENTDSNIISESYAKNKLVAVTRNSNSYNELIEKGFSENKNLYVVASAHEAFKLLISGKVDLVYNDPNAVQEYLLSKNIKQQLKFNTITPVNRRDSYIAINVNSNNNLIEKLKVAMSEFEKTKRYLYLLNKKGDH
jgi:ABC-type amino acid transport substrate-binding protein